MADKRISELTTIVTVDNTADFFPIVDTSETETKKITPTALKTALSLNNVNNTSDANKPVSDATQTALNAKQNSLGYTPEDTANKSTTLNSDRTSNTKYPSVKSVYDWAVSVFQTALGYTPLNRAGDSISGDINNTNTGYFQLPQGTTAQRPASPSNGMRRYNTDTQRDEFYANGSWQNHARLSGDTFTGNIAASNLSGTNTGDNATNSQYSGLAASKQDTLVSATNIKTINSTTLLGSGDIAVQSTLVSGTNIKTVEGQSLVGSGNIDLAKGDVGLGNVDNTSDANKPVSTATQTALDLKTNKLIVANRQTASYTLVLGDADKIVEMNVASANNLTVPASVFAAGNQILLAQYGAGQTTVVAGSGMTIRSNGGKLKLSAQYSGASLVFVSATEAYLFGDITA
jgi:hypothetical protein